MGWLLTEAVAVPPAPLMSPSVPSATGWKEAELEAFLKQWEIKL